MNSQIYCLMTGEIWKNYRTSEIQFRFMMDFIANKICHMTDTPTSPSTFYLWLYGVGHMIKDHSDSERKPAVTTWATHSYYQQLFFYMHHPAENNTYHSLCYPSHHTLDGTRNSSMGAPWGIDPMTHKAMSRCSTMEQYYISFHHGKERCEMWLSYNFNISKCSLN